MGHESPLLTQAQLDRYARQIRLAEIGLRGQARLRHSKVAIVGAGALGSPAAIYLAAAGVGTIGLIDADVVDRSNLHRQPLHFDNSVGELKVQSGSRHLAQLNPEVQVVVHPVSLTAANALAILGDYDLVVNGTDNFPARYLVNDACVLLGKPLVDASILEWDGQLNVFMPGQGCYRCLFPQPPAPGTVPACAEGGIVGAVAGVMGTLQALEAVKILLGMHGVMSDRTLAMDAASGTFRTSRRHRRANCPVCGDAPSVTAPIDYELFCGLPAAGPAVSGAPGAVPAAVPMAPAAVPAAVPMAPAAVPGAGAWGVSAAAAARWFGDPEVAWIDVREPSEFADARLPGSRLIRLDDLPDMLDELPRERIAIFVCVNGQRSGLAVELMRGQGYTRTYNLDGGIRDWENHGYAIERGDQERGVYDDEDA